MTKDRKSGFQADGSYILDDYTVSAEYIEKVYNMTDEEIEAETKEAIKQAREEARKAQKYLKKRGKIQKKSPGKQKQLLFSKYIGKNS